MPYNFSDYKLMKIQLTHDELEVLSQLIAGFTLEEVACNLGMSREAISQCLSGVYSKLQKTGVSPTPNTLFPELALLDEDDLGAIH